MAGEVPWLVYSKLLDGEICKFYILFPEQPGRGGGRDAKAGVLALSPYPRPCTKALGKNGVLVGHAESDRHASWCSSTSRPFQVKF